jgi:hypothetical protein
VRQLETALPQDFQRMMQGVRSSSVGHLVAGQLSDAGGKLGSAIAGPVTTLIRMAYVEDVPHEPRAVI